MFLFSLFIVIVSFITMIVSFINLVTKPILNKNSIEHKDKVSILIPARNEEKNLKKLLNSIRTQIYQNIEVIVLDDNSEDETYNIAKSFSDIDKRFFIIKGEKLPDNWLGKNWACSQLSKKATGNYFIFIDADTEVYPELITSSINYVKKTDMKLLSLFPEQVTISIGEKIIVSSIYHILLSLLILHFIKIPFFSSLSAANGQFMLFNAENYRKNLWHEQVKDSMVEDIQIIKKMKKNKFKVSALLGNELIKCRMYNNLKECVLGFEKNILLIFGNTILLLLYIFLILLGIFFTSNIIHFELILLFNVLSKIFTSILSKQSILLNILLYPLQGFFIILISIRALYKKFTRKDIIWKGREINIT